MGYTHYWHQPENCFSFESFERLRSMVEQLISVAAIAPRWIGIELMDFGSSDTICFNGSPLAGMEESEEDVCCEDFQIHNYDTGFYFCKTNTKPYDAVVTAALIAAGIVAKENGSLLAITTDGSLGDWQEGIELFKECFPELLDRYPVAVSEDGDLILGQGDRIVLQPDPNDQKIG